MADDPTAHAIDVIVRHIAAVALEHACDDMADFWGDYPDIGINDITQIAAALASESARLYPGWPQVQAAYEHLKGRGSDGRG